MVQLLKPQDPILRLTTLIALFFLCADQTFTNTILAQEAAKPEIIEAVASSLDRPVDFAKDIQPILDDKCVACHNVAITESKLVLEDVASIFKGGKRGPSVVAKDVAKSLIYQMASRALEPAMPPLPNKVSAAALTPQELGLLKKWIEEGATAGTSSGQHTVLWQSIPQNMHSIYSVALSTWGRWAACGRANQIDLYDLTTGDYVARLQDPALLNVKKDGRPFYPMGAAHRDFIHALAFNPEGNLLASAGYREVKLWQRQSNVQISHFPQDQSASSIAVSPNGKWLAIGRLDHTIVLQDLADAKSRSILTGHTGPVSAVQFPRSCSVVPLIKHYVHGQSSKGDKPASSKLQIQSHASAPTWTTHASFLVIRVIISFAHGRFHLNLQNQPTASYQLKG